MFKWIAKKYIMSKANSLLDEHKADVERFRVVVRKWAARLRNVLACLEGALAKLDDGKLDDDEVKQTVAAVQELVKEW